MATTTFDSTNLRRVTRIKNPHYRRDGLKSYVHLLSKYNITPTVSGPYMVVQESRELPKPSLLSRLLRRKKTVKTASERPRLVKKDALGRPGDVPATDSQNDIEYLAQVSIGTPAQTFSLDFDTGSADLWVFSTELSGSQGNHAAFNPSQSSTFRASPGQTWQITYADSSNAFGNVGTDVLNVGGLIIKNQAIELAQSVSPSFANGVNDGLLGLAWGRINSVKPNRVQTPVENMISQSDIPKSAELFTACLGSYHDVNDPDKGQSFYTFGYIDQDIIKASGRAIHYTPVDKSNGFWQFQSASASVNGTSIARPGNTAIADTGTTLAVVSDQVCQAIYGAIPGAKQDPAAQGWVFPSSTTVQQLPVVEFAVGTQLFRLQKEDLSFSNMGNGYIYGGVQSRGNFGFDILGDVFLKSVYAIFDQGNQRFGVVPRIEPTQHLAA